MDPHVAWLLEVAVKPSQLEAFRTLMSEMVASTHAEPGTLDYQWFIDGDNTVVLLSERYVDSAATLMHLATFGEKFAERFLAAVDPVRLTVMGSPSEDVRAALSGFGPTYLTTFGGFTR